MKERLAMVLFVLVLGSVLTSALIVVDSVTLPVIRRNDELQVKGGVLAALGIAADGGAIEKAYAANVTERQGGDLTYYVSLQGDVAFAFEGTGLWGPIEGVIALEPDMERLKGITILRQEETPGLGGRIAEPDYLKAYQGRPFKPALRSVAAGKGGAATDVDAITGATMTSNAFVGILNAELARFARGVKGGVR
jgi:Na+-transporting NADH:ubiquinone oxidoreductase subunit C